MHHFQSSRRRTTRLVAAVIAVALASAAVVTRAPLTSASLIGGLVCPVTNTIGVSSAGWDDSATTTPTTMAQVDQATGASALQAKGITGAGIGVALIDSGVAPVEGLTGTGKVINGPDLSFESQYPATQYVDTYGHGTHMAGLIAGDDGPGGGFKGVAPGAHLVVLKVATHDRGAVDVSQILAAIDWVVQHRNDPGMNIRVINLAYGTESVQSYQLDPIAFAVENAWRHGIVTVVSGGNGGTSHGSLTDPATDPYVLAVGAANLNSTSLLSCATVAPFSSRSSGRHVDLVAPGVSIASLRDPGSAIDQAHPGAVVGSRFFRGSGTSQATAVVSGAVALLLQARPSLTPDQVKALLTSTASPLALLDQAAEGAGMVNVNAAAAWLTVAGSTQTWREAAGTGSLSAARGGSYVTLNGVALTGEMDIFGRPWNGASWAAASAAASAWTGGTWNGSRWTGLCWCGTSWSASTWSGAQWSGAQWSGAQWSGAQWSGAQWSGAQWSGAQWSGAQWSGAQWG